jgi:hypothetical protein
MAAMTPPSSAATARRLVLVPATPREDRDAAVRRFRLARVHLDDADGREAQRAVRLARARRR